MVAKKKRATKSKVHKKVVVEEDEDMMPDNDETEPTEIPPAEAPPEPPPEKPPEETPPPVTDPPAQEAPPAQASTEGELTVAKLLELGVEGVKALKGNPETPAHWHPLIDEYLANLDKTVS